MRKNRKARRYPCGLTGTLHRAGETVGTHVTIRDISSHGCELKLAEGSRISKKCELYFDWRDMHVGLEAEVAWSDAKERAGLKFVRVDGEIQRRLNALCDALRTQSPPQQHESHATPSAPIPTDGPTAARSATPPTSPSRPRQEASGPSRRRVPRYLTELPGHLANPATGTTTGVTLVSLSVTGARLEGSALPDTGQACELQAECESGQLLLRGNVVWRTKDGAGVRFESVDEEMDKRLRRTCANLRLQPPGPLSI
ncbi:MAG: PilZ domain-containing protein [Terriglobia bacterium]